MKCPRCNFVTSNKKDLCPRCEFDLRQRKRELGLPIANTAASYEQLLAEQRKNDASHIRPASPSILPVQPAPVKAPVPFWKKLMSRGSSPEPDFPAVTRSSVPPSPLTAAPVPASEPASEASPVMPPPVSAPISKQATESAKKSSAETEDGDLLQIELDALSDEISEIDFSITDDNAGSSSELEFSLGGSSSAAPAEKSAGDLLFSSTPATSLSAETGTNENPNPPLDLQELISALDQLSGREDLDADDDSLFPTPASSIDANLDEIIHALDDLDPQEDIDEIELFQTRISDLAESLDSSVQEAKAAAEELKNHPFERENSLPDSSPLPEEKRELQAEADSVEDEFQTLLQEFDTDTGENEQSEQDQSASLEADEEQVLSAEDTPYDEALSSAQLPQVTPEVIEFGEDDEAFEKTLDELIGDAVLDVKAVKVQPSKHPSPVDSPTLGFIADDGMEITFEVEVDGASLESIETAEAEASDEEDALLSGLLDSFNSLQAGTEQKMIAPRRTADDDGATETAEPVSAEETALPHFVLQNFVSKTLSKSDPERQRRIQRLLDRLSFLSDDLIEEVRSLLRADAESAPAMDRHPLAPRTVESTQTSVSSVPSGQEPEDLAALESELRRELQELQAQGLTIYSDPELAEADFRPDGEPEFETTDSSSPDDFLLSDAELRELESDIPEDEQTDLESLQQELSEEIALLEQQGLHVHAAEPEEDIEEPAADAEPVIVPALPEQPEETELLALQEELSEEIALLEQQGLHVHAAEQDDTTEEPPADAEQEIEAEDATPALTEQPEETELLALQEELSGEIALLEQQGLHVHAAEQDDTTEEPPADAEQEIEAEDATPALTEQPDETELLALQEELSEEIALLEQQGLHVHAAAQDDTTEEPPADAEQEIEAEDATPTLPEQPEETELLALQEELSEEVALLEQQGLHIHTTEQGKNTEEPPADAEFDLGTEAAGAVVPDRPEQTELLALYQEMPSSEETVEQPDDDGVLSPAGEEESAQQETLSPPSSLALSMIPQFSEAGVPNEPAQAADEEPFAGAAPSNEQVMQPVETIDDGREEPTAEMPPVDDLPAVEESGSNTAADPASLSTGRFLAQDFVNITTLVAEEKFLPAAEPESPSVKNALFDDEESEEIDLAQLARLFETESSPASGADVPPVESSETQEAVEQQENLQLNSAVSTGVFLASDLEKILGPDGAAEGDFAPVVVAPELWDRARQDVLQRTAEHQREIELNVSDLAALSQSDAMAVLFDLIQDEIRDPTARRSRVTEIPTSSEKQVENLSLKQALTTFEKEERILSKRRSKLAANPQLAEEKIIVPLVAAPAWRRLAASLCDAIAVFLLSAMFAWISFLPSDLMQPLLRLHSPEWFHFLPYSCEFLGLCLLVWIISTTLLISGWGQTFGGHFLNIEVVTTYGEIPGLSAAGLRALSQVNTLLSAGLGYLPILGGRRALHDAVSCTFVRSRREKDTAP
jgi:hypothetical protein